ncbi:hypothetical protein Tco_0923962 [Tanacetum coccineum]|uniref:Uncharacterized protein n=1 Tax=Tanacetum coccineum TaxID=301880 RepID=A0ABQ5D4R5_9ASTR
MAKGQRQNFMGLKGERPRTRLESQQRTGERLRLSRKYNNRAKFLNLRSLIFSYSHVEDFGPTTEKDGNINLVKEVVDPNRRTDQTESQSALLLNYLKTNSTGGKDCSCNVEQRVPERAAAEAEAATMSISKRAIPDATTVTEVNEIA